MTFEQTLEVLRERFLTARSEGSVELQVNLSGRDGGKFYVTSMGGRRRLEAGMSPTPNLIVHTSDRVLGDLLDGKTTAMEAFEAGKIKFKGDVKLALKLKKLFT